MAWSYKQSVRLTALFRHSLSMFPLSSAASSTWSGRNPCRPRWSLTSVSSSVFVKEYPQKVSLKSCRRNFVCPWISWILTGLVLTFHSAARKLFQLHITVNLIILKRYFLRAWLFFKYLSSSSKYFSIVDGDTVVQIAILAGYSANRPFIVSLGRFSGDQNYKTNLKSFSRHKTDGMWYWVCHIITN